MTQELFPYILIAVVIIAILFILLGILLSMNYLIEDIYRLESEINFLQKKIDEFK